MDLLSRIHITTNSLAAGLTLARTDPTTADELMAMDPDRQVDGLMCLLAYGPGIELLRMAVPELPSGLTGRAAIDWIYDEVGRGR